MSTSSQLENPDLSQTSEAILEVKHLYKKFVMHRLNPLARTQAVQAVENVSFALYAGRATALVGESGSGKSTIARILARLYEPTEGEVHFHGKPLKKQEGAGSLSTYRRNVQMVFQDPFSSLNPVHNVQHHLSRPLRVNNYVQNAKQETEHILALLRRVSLTPAEQFISKYPHQLSGGQRQRVVIARALATRPEVLLADEPVSMLDVSIRLDILNLLLRLKKEERIAVLFITHDIASARYFAEETLVLYAGQMVEGGPSDVITQQPRHPYTRLLISSAPNPKVLDRVSDGAEEMPARGEIPSLIHPPSGCRFHPRCPHAMPVCKERFPARTILGDNHWIHCHLYGEEAKLPAENLAN
ncbi:MAG TPA: ABC transporter ATP-binding protein [Ktedonobacteraceae bacterium]|jgi:peptide/nickel transport system ATP-binding protein|nr:ABC transporter ATP-binding protein [Ktedonobacteraceae bacterium]